MRFRMQNARMTCAGSERWAMLLNPRRFTPRCSRCYLLLSTALQCLHVYTLLANPSTWPPPVCMQAMLPACFASDKDDTFC